MLALIEAVRDERIPDASIAIVISDRADAHGICLARERGLETLVIERRNRTREEHEQEMLVALREREISLVCLAGYMRLLSPLFIEAYRGRILNIHPSLLPAFPASTRNVRRFGTASNTPAARFTLWMKLWTEAVLSRRQLCLFMTTTPKKH
jgi:phosphoribosylglycinamide formyltransferase-1